MVPVASEETKHCTSNKDDAPATCQHHWAIETPNGAFSRGRCKRCGAERDFRNAEPENPFTTTPVVLTGSTPYRTPRQPGVPRSAPPPVACGRCGREFRPQGLPGHQRACGVPRAQRPATRKQRVYARGRYTSGGACPTCGKGFDGRALPKHVRWCSPEFVEKHRRIRDLAAGGLYPTAIARKVGVSPATVKRSLRQEVA